MAEISIWQGSAVFTTGKTAFGFYDSDEEFAKNWFGVLEVDHVDGDHTNNDPSNLKTKCSDEHGYKTQKNKDYLNRYEDGKLKC